MDKIQGGIISEDEANEEQIQKVEIKQWRHSCSKYLSGKILSVCSESTERKVKYNNVISHFRNNKPNI